MKRYGVSQRRAQPALRQTITRAKKVRNLTGSSPVGGASSPGQRPTARPSRKITRRLSGGNTVAALLLSDPVSPVQSVRRATVDRPPAQVAILRHRHLRVPQLVGDLSCGEPRPVELGRRRPAENVTRHPRELRRSAGIPEIPRGVRRVAPPARRVREHRTPTTHRQLATAQHRQHEGRKPQRPLAGTALGALANQPDPVDPDQRVIDLDDAGRQVDLRPGDRQRLTDPDAGYRASTRTGREDPCAPRRRRRATA